MLEIIFRLIPHRTTTFWLFTATTQAWHAQTPARQVRERNGGQAFTSRTSGTHARENMAVAASLYFCSLHLQPIASSPPAYEQCAESSGTAGQGEGKYCRFLPLGANKQRVCESLCSALPHSGSQCLQDGVHLLQQPKPSSGRRFLFPLSPHERRCLLHPKR